jgi:Family of unknown function (DUF6544)
MSAAATSARTFDPERLKDLPEPARRYLSHAIHPGAPLHRGVRLWMAGRVRAGVWLPFSAVEECDGRSIDWRAQVAVARVRVLEVQDAFHHGVGTQRGTVLGRFKVFGGESEDIARSAAGRAALETVFTPWSWLRESVAWRAEDDGHVVATVDVPPERVEVHLNIDVRGALCASWANRWTEVGGGRFGYRPCGMVVMSERRFGDLTIPRRLVGGWGYGTPEWEPFFEAEISDLEPLR